MSRKAMTVTNVSITRGQVHTISQLLIQNDLVIMRPPYGGGGFKRYRNQSVCLSRGVAA